MKNLVVPVLVCFLVGCSDNNNPVGTVSFEDAPGALAVAVRTDVMYRDTARNRDVRATFWYPAEGANKGAEQAEEGAGLLPGSERYPLVVLVHGINDNAPGTWPYLAPHLASHGYIVAAPSTGSNLNNNEDLVNHPGDVSFLLDAVLGVNNLEPMFLGRIDSSKITVGGFSFGSFATYMLAYDPQYQDTRPRAVILMAGGGEDPAPVRDDLSMMVIMGTSDIVIPYEVGLNTYEAASAPKYIVSLEGGGHVGFTSSDDSGIGAIMSEERHESLTRQSVLAFLTSVFADDVGQRAAADTFLRQAFADENVDVEVLFEDD